MKSCQERLNLNETQRPYFKYELQFKIKCMDRQAGSINANKGYIPIFAFELYIHKPSRSWHTKHLNLAVDFSIRNFFTYYSRSNPECSCNLEQNQFIYNWHFQYRKRLLLRFIQHFQSDAIFNMDHMHISGTEPSSVP